MATASGKGPAGLIGRKRAIISPLWASLDATIDRDTDPVTVSERGRDIARRARPSVAKYVGARSCRRKAARACSTCAAWLLAAPAVAMQLEETTDREGFKDSPYCRNFYSLLLEFKRFTTEVHEFFGRAWVGFQTTRREQLAKVDTRQTVEVIARNIKSAMSGASEQQRAVAGLTTRFNVALTKSRKAAQSLSESEQLTPALQRRALESFDSLNVVIEDATRVLEQVNAYLARLENMQELGHVLNDQVESIRQQVDDMYETVALGLTAEAISHEVFRIADELANRTKRAETLARSSNVPNKIVPYLEHVHGAVQALRKQVSFFHLHFVMSESNERTFRYETFWLSLRRFINLGLAKAVFLSA